MWIFDCNRIRLARESKDLTQKEFAAKLGTETHRIKDWEAGRVKPGQSSLVAICNLMGLSPRFFFDKTGHNSNNISVDNDEI